MTHLRSLAAAPLFWLAMSASLLVQANPLEEIPAGALGFAVIRDLSDANAKVGKLTEKMQLPVPDLLSMVKGLAGVDKGLDESGGLAVAVLAAERAADKEDDDKDDDDADKDDADEAGDGKAADSKDGTGDDDDDDDSPAAGLAVFVFAPVTDYQAFIAAFSPADPKAAISEVTVFGQPRLVAQKGKFAVFAMDTARKADLEKLLAGESSVTDTVAPLADWLAEQQLAVVVTPAGKTRLFQTLSEALPDQAKLEADAKAIKDAKGDDKDASDDDDVDGDEDATDEGKSADEPGEDAADEDAAGPPAAALANVGQMFGMFKEFLAAADQQVTHLAIGLKIEDSATIHLAARVLFVPDGKLAAWSKDVKVPAEGLLAGVPDGKFVFAYGGVAAHFSPEVWKVLSQFNENGLQILGLDEEGRQRYAAASLKLQAGKRLTSGVMGMLRPGDSPFTTAISIEHVVNADEHFKLTRETLALLETDLKSPKTKAPLYTLSDIKVGDLEAIEVVTDFDAITGLGALKDDDGDAPGSDAPGADMARGLLGKMFGKEGKIYMYVAKATETTVVSAYSKEQLVPRVQHVRSGAVGLAANADIAKTTALLPAGSQWVAYANPEGIVQLVTTFVQGMFGPEFELPAFPQTEPIGLAARVSETGLDAEIVVPDGVVAGLGVFIAKVGQMFSGGGALP